MGGVLSTTAFATTVGLGATFGLFGLTQPESPVGRLGGPAPAAAQVDPPQGSGAAVTRSPAVTDGSRAVTASAGDDADD